jgi:hypothetical protein
MLQEGEIIVKRSFFLEDDEGKQAVVTVCIATPSQPEGEYAQCRFELTSPVRTIEMSAAGLDALDALMACLALAGTNIAGLNESVYGGRLRWEGSPAGGRGLGLPTVEEGWPSANEIASEE